MTVLNLHNPRATKLAAFAASEKEAKAAAEDFCKQAELNGDYAVLARTGDQVAAKLYAWNIVDNEVEYK